MAELGEVLDAMAVLVTAALYDVTTATPLLGIDAQIGVGWPDNDELDKALANGTVFVGMFPQDGERASVDWQFNYEEAPRITASIEVAFNVANDTVTVTGTVGKLDVAGVLTNGTAYNFELVPGDTAAVVAGKIAAVVPGATVSGTVVTVPHYVDTVFRVDTNGIGVMAVGARERQIQINIWAANQGDRDKVSGAILAAINLQQFLAVSTFDGLVTEAAKINYASGAWSDKPQAAGGYMQSIVSKVVFHSTVIQPFYTILFTASKYNSPVSTPLLHS